MSKSNLPSVQIENPFTQEEIEIMDLLIQAHNNLILH
jgi:hypothetical protein